MIGREFGNYRVTARLGEGGMGTVYRATDTMLDRDVALKVLRPELARQAALVERFRAEAIALARLRHEHIAALYGLERQGDELMMVMEFVSGETLESRLQRGGALTVAEALPVLRGVLAALGHAHAKGVVHRDIKPANVMIDAEGVVKVMDFGIARLIGENRQTRAGVAVGTPSYMAPEQLRGEDVDGRTDLYAAGALLFELLTGRVAFQADSDYALMMHQLHELPPPASTIAPGVPRAIDGVIHKAMAKKPAQRFTSATDFQRALETLPTQPMLVEPLRDVAATVAARAPRDWRVYAIGACVTAIATFGVLATRSAPDTPLPAPAPPAELPVLATLPGRAVASPDPLPARADPVTMVAGGTTVDAARAPVDEPRAPVAAPVPSGRADAIAPASAGGRAVEAPPARKPVAATPARVATDARTPAPSPTPEDAAPAPAPRAAAAEEPADAGERRAEDAARRCVAAIARNDGDAASRLLGGDAGGLLAVVEEGRVTGASISGSETDRGAERVMAMVTARVAYRTAFGGNKSGTVVLTVAASRSGDGWRAGGCTVQSANGIR